MDRPPPSDPPSDPPPASPSDPPPRRRGGILSAPGVRHGLFVLGLVCTGLGAAGLLLPFMPGTVFLLVALWAFSRSSDRFHNWLYTHPLLGGPLRHWHEHRIIPLPAKIAALCFMGASLAYVTLFVAEDWVLPSIVGAVMALVAAYIVTRPHRRATVKIEP